MNKTKKWPLCQKYILTDLSRNRRIKKREMNMDNNYNKKVFKVVAWAVKKVMIKTWWIKTASLYMMSLILNNHQSINYLNLNRLNHLTIARNLKEYLEERTQIEIRWITSITRNHSTSNLISNSMVKKYYQNLSNCNKNIN